MITIFRRHLKSCKHRSRRYKHCSCPISAEGNLHGEKIRKSLNLRNWEAATRLIRDWEIHGEVQTVSVAEGCQRWLDDCAARKLKPQSTRKYREISKELSENFGAIPLRSVTVDDLRKLRESWKYSSGTIVKRLEMIRSFFSFCVVSGWIEKNPAKAIKSPVAKQVVTLPYSDQEWEKILWALDAYKEIHSQSPIHICQQLRALVLLMRYSGLRISDAVSLKCDRIDAAGRLFIYQAKTGNPVLVPLPAVVRDALTVCERGDAYYFWNGTSTLKSRLTEWQERMKKVFVIAGLPEGHSHRLRDSFAVSLLVSGVPLHIVSVLLGHTSIKTTEKHYAPWVKSRQDALETAVRATF